ncbi:protein maelstrom homolog [Malaya genurostris]|uniref:protein maelstrom homolog n=1 Tax=Malaya genurostris TaxID=325434 RepID=UPI0026F3963D|nr:protein maelstrom homolog [Malaya genurostris]XP_058450701.1 protein maelstrom homolog [Malaya genurostris]
MPSRKKPAAKGPFFFFMLEFRKREESKGKSFPGGMDQLMREAGPHWNKLTTAERETYRDHAKSYKLNPISKCVEKYTAQGIPFSQIEKEKQMRLKKEQTIRKAVTEMIETAACNNVLEKMKVYLISFNYFCKTSKQLYIPAEMAIISYSLERGVIDKFHQFVNPVNLPLGLAYEANIMSDESHRLPIPPESMGETDYAVLLEKLLDFTENGEKKYRLFFAEESQVPVVENILNQFVEESKDPHKFLVCPLGDFFFQLKRTTESYGLDICTFPAKTVADILLKKDTYEYTSGIACEFHEKLGNPRFCCLSKIIRLSYIISDSCCLDLNIDMVAGRHLPMNANTTLCSDLSETGSKFYDQSDRMSFVSSSDLTHLSMPKVQKIRSKSPFRTLESESGQIIYSSRAGTSKHGQEKQDTVSTNPFHIFKTEKMGSDSIKLDTTVVEAGPSESYNPFSRQTKLENVRQPREIGVVGHGRGSLLGMTGSNFLTSFQRPVGNGFTVAGRGLGFFGTFSTVSSIKSGECGDDED